MKYIKISIIVICLFLLINTVSAEKTLLFDDWVEPEKSIRLGDFKIKPYYTTNDNVLFKADEFTVAVEKESCLTQSPFQLCFNKTRLTINGEVVPDEIHSSEVETELEIQIYGILGELEITREFENNFILQNEKVEVNVIIENIGDADATNIEYSEKYPDSFQIINAENCFIEDEDTIIWTGSLKKEKIHKCSYSLIGLEEKTHTSKATVEYYNGIEEEKIYDSQKLTIPKPYLEVEYDLTKSKLIPGDIIFSNITVINNHDSNIEIENLLVKIPKGFSLIKSDILSSNNEWKGTIIEEQSIYLELQAIKTGTLIIETIVDYSVNDNMLNVIKEKKIKVENDLTIDVIENIADMAYNKSNPVMIKISNPNKKILNNVRTEINSNLKNFEKIVMTKDTLGKNNNYLVFDNEIIPKENGEFYFNISIEYKNEFNEKFTYEINKSFEVSNSVIITKETQELETNYNQENISEQTNATITKKMLPTLDFSGESNKSKGTLILAIVFSIGFIFFLIRYITRSY
jgi:hypothetical protein